MAQQAPATRPKPSRPVRPVADLFTFLFSAFSVVIAVGLVSILVVGLADPTASLTWISDFPFLYTAVFFGVLLLTLYCVVIHRKSLLGPLLYCELLRQARRGRQVWLRCSYVLLLLVVLWLGHQQWAALQQRHAESQDTPVAANEMARLAQNFTYSILVVQNLTVLLLAPLAVTGAIIEERQRGTLDFLLLSHLHDREIVLGKLAARLIALTMVVLGGLPVLALIYLLGGVSLYLIAGGFLVTAISLLHAGSASMYFGVIGRSRVGAIVNTYIFLFLTMTCCSCQPWSYLASPFGYLVELDQQLRGHAARSVQGIVGAARLSIGASLFASGDSLGILLDVTLSYAGFQAIFILSYLALAIRYLRRMHRDRRSVPGASRDASPHFVLTREFFMTPRQLQTYMVSMTYSPSETDDPLLWREWLNSRSWPYALCYFLTAIMLVIAGSSGLAFLLNIVLAPSAAAGQGYNTMASIFVMLILAGVWVGEGMRTACCLVQEREQHTLQSLLLLPSDWTRIFWTKGLAGAWWARWIVPVLALLWLVGIVSGELHPLGVLLLIIACIGHLTFIIGLGMFLSQVCRTSVQANLAMGSILLLVVAGPYFLLPVDAAALQAGLNPLHAWLLLGWSPSEYAGRNSYGWFIGQERLAAILGALIYGTAGAVLWCTSQYLFLRNPLRE
jgi:ABC-type transport system involved in multi-copper enzyme maturation permease subunit